MKKAYGLLVIIYVHYTHVAKPISKNDHLHNYLFSYSLLVPRQLKPVLHNEPLF